MTTQKLEEKILYNARGEIHSKLMCQIYEPLPILQGSEKTYGKIPLLPIGKTYERYPILESGNYDKHNLFQNKETGNYSGSKNSGNYSTNKAA